MISPLPTAACGRKGAAHMQMWRKKVARALHQQAHQLLQRVQWRATCCSTSQQEREGHAKQLPELCV